MRFAPNRAWRLALALALTAPLAACATPSSSLVAPEGVGAIATKPKVPMGTLNVDVSRLFGDARPTNERHTLGYGLATGAVTQVRLVLRYPGQITDKVEPGYVSPVLATVPLSTNSAINTTVSCTVPAGLNRVITVEALNATGNVLMRLRSAADVSAGSIVTIKLNFLYDAVARTLAAMIEENEPILHTTSLITPLATYLAAYTGFNETANTTSVMPLQYLEGGNIASALRERPEPLAWLAAPPVPEDLYSEYNDSEDSFAQLSRLIDMTDYPTETYDPLQWRATLIAPIGGVWNAHQDMSFANFDPVGPSGMPTGHYATITGMLPGTYTMILSHPTNDTTLYLDVDSGFDGPLYYNGRLQGSF